MILLIDFSAHTRVQTAEKKTKHQLRDTWVTRWQSTSFAGLLPIIFSASGKAMITEKAQGHSEKSVADGGGESTLEMPQTFILKA